MSFHKIESRLNLSDDSKITENNFIHLFRLNFELTFQV